MGCRTFLPFYYIFFMFSPLLIFYLLLLLFFSLLLNVFIIFIPSGKKTKGTVTQIFQEEGNMGKVLPEYLSRWTMDKVKAEGVNIVNNSKVSKVEKLANGQLKLLLSTGKEVSVI